MQRGQLVVNAPFVSIFLEDIILCSSKVLFLFSGISAYINFILKCNITVFKLSIFLIILFSG